MSDQDPSVPPAASVPAGWGPSEALAIGRGGSAHQSTSITNTSSILRGKSFVGFLTEEALNQVCGVATADSNNNKRLNKKLDGICIKHDCKTPSHLNMKRSSNFLPGWYLTRKEQKRVHDVHMFPRGDVALAQLHTESLLNLVIKDKMLAVTIFDRLEHSDTTEKGRLNTQALSMDKGFRKEVDSEEGGQDEDDLDLSYDAESDDVTLVQVSQTQSKSTKPIQKETFSLEDAKRLIAELPLDHDELSSQEAMHLKILMAAAKAADIDAAGSFVPPAIVTNLLKVTNALLGVVEESNDRQSQLGFQLDENVSSTNLLNKVIKRRTSKGAYLPNESSENIWKGLQALMERQSKYEQQFKDLEVELKVTKIKSDKMQQTLNDKNVEVESMRLGFRRTESLLLNRILVLENEIDGQKESFSQSNEYLLLKEKESILENRLDTMDRVISTTNGLTSSTTNGVNSTETADIYATLDNMSKEVNDLRARMVDPPSKDASTAFGSPIWVGDSMMSGPSDIAAYLQRNSELKVNTGFLIGYDIIFQRVFDAGTSNYNQLESIKNQQIATTMGLTAVESYALFCMKLRLPQIFCSKKGGIGGMTKMITHSDWRPTTGRVIGGVAHELENKLGEIISSYETAIRQNYSPSDPVQAVWLNTSLEYLHTSYTFVQRLLRYIDEQFRFLTIGTEKEDAWDVIMKAVKSIFEDFFAPVRDIPLSELPRSDNEVGKLRFCSKLIWNSLQTMTLTKDMLAVDIKHHHMISSSYTEWSLINSGKTEAKKAMEAVNKMSTELKDLSTSVAAVKKVSNDASFTAKGAKTSADKALSRVDKLEKK